MQVSRSLAFDCNLSLPRLMQEESALEMSQVPIFAREDNNYVSFQDILSIANNFNLSIREAYEFLLDDHALNECDVIVLENRFLTNERYREAVMESFDEIPMRFKSAGVDYELSFLINECVDNDLEEGTTERTEALCELFGNLFGILGSEWNDTKDAASQAADTAKQKGTSMASKIVNSDFVQGKMKDAANWAAEKYLGDDASTEQTGDRLANNAGKVAEKVANTVVDKAAGVVKNKAWDYTKQALLGIGIAGATGVMANQVNNLTNQEAIDNANPSMAAKMMNTLKGALSSLTNRQATAPPTQQGLISRMIEKIKNAIKALARKVGLG